VTLTKGELLAASDLITREVDLRPHIDGSVIVQSLPATYSNQAISEAMEMTTDSRGVQTSRVNTARLEELQVMHGLIEPRFDTLEEVQQFGRQCGPSWQKISDAIRDISGVSQEAIDRTSAMFQAGGRETPGDSASNGARAGDGGPDRPVPARGAAEDAGRGDVRPDERT